MRSIRPLFLPLAVIALAGCHRSDPREELFAASLGPDAKVDTYAIYQTAQHGRVICGRLSHTDPLNGSEPQRFVLAKDEVIAEIEDHLATSAVRGNFELLWTTRCQGNRIAGSSGTAN